MDSRHGKGHFDENEYQRGITLNFGLAGVFGLMFLGLLATAISALFTVSSPFMLNLVFHTNALYFFLFAPLALVFLAFPRVWDMSPAGAILLFIVYALLNGVTLSAIFIVYALGDIATAFFAAAGMFGIMAIYGAVTKADLSGVGSFLLMGLFGIIIASVLNWFFVSDTMHMLITYAGIAIFLGLTAYDVQRLQRLINEHAGDVPTGVIVKGALHLYLDFINIFLFLLRLFGRRR